MTNVQKQLAASETSGAEKSKKLAASATKVKITEGELAAVTKSLSISNKALAEAKAALATTTKTLQTTTNLLSNTQAALKASQDTNQKLRSQRKKETSDAPKAPAVDNVGMATPSGMSSVGGPGQSDQRSGQQNVGHHAVGRTRVRV